MNWYLDVLKKYMVFEGRARRKELWMFLLFHFIILAALMILENIIGTGGIIQMLYTLGVLLPCLSVGVRRLHDTGRSGWWILIGFIPIANFALIFFYVMEGTEGENAYGPNPKDSVA